MKCKIYLSFINDNKSRRSKREMESKFSFLVYKLFADNHDHVQGEDFLKNITIWYYPSIKNSWAIQWW